MSKVTMLKSYAGNDFNSVRRAVEDIQQFSAELDTVNINSAYQVLSEDDIVLSTNNGNDFTITLPFIDDSQKKLYIVKKLDAGNTITIAARGSELIDGASSTTLTSQYQTLRFMPQREIGIATEIRQWHIL